MNNLTMRKICEHIYTECGDDVKLDEDGYFDIGRASDKVKNSALVAFVASALVDFREVPRDNSPCLFESALEFLHKDGIDECMRDYLLGLWADQSVDSQISESRELDND